MILNDESRTRVKVTLSLDTDPTGSTVEVKVGTTWYAASWIGAATESNGVYTQSARTATYFAGPNWTGGGSSTVLAIGRHAVEVRVTWSGADAVAQWIGYIDVT